MLSAAATSHNHGDNLSYSPSSGLPHSKSAYEGPIGSRPWSILPTSEHASLGQGSLTSMVDHSKAPVAVKFWRCRPFEFRSVSTWTDTWWLLPPSINPRLSADHMDGWVVPAHHAKDANKTNKRRTRCRCLRAKRSTIMLSLYPRLHPVKLTMDDGQTCICLPFRVYVRVCELVSQFVYWVAVSFQKMNECLDVWRHFANDVIGWSFHN